jgi:hypothetical protein
VAVNPTNPNHIVAGSNDHFFNNQNQAAWEVDLDSPIMVTKSTNGGESFGQPVPTVQLEDGLSDMPFAVISRQTV